MMGHIRFATVGHVDLANVHPFSREMWGIQWCFSHNGDIPMFHETPHRRLTSLAPTGESHYHPVGTTDSEAAFCAILDALHGKFRRLPSLPVLYDALRKLCEEIVAADPPGTILNFLLACGPHTLWAYSWPGSRPGSTVWNGLHYTTRQYPFSKTKLSDVDHKVDFSSCGRHDCTSIITTKPLTEDEHWRELSPGDLIVFDEGKPHITPSDLFQLELMGHGLHSTVLEPPELELDMRTYNVDPTSFQGLSSMRENR